MPAFSLIELLAVIAIISILLAAAVPVFSDSANNARRSSREIVKAHLLRARAHAIASGNPTAIAIPAFDTSTTLSARALTLFEVEKSGSDYVLSTEPKEDGSPAQPQLQRWETLPGSFHFLPSSLISSANPTIMDSSVRIDTKDGSCHVIVFGSSGSIVCPAAGQGIRLAFAQARRNRNTLQITQRNGDSPVFELIEINRLTGRTRNIDP